MMEVNGFFDKFLKKPPIFTQYLNIMKIKNYK